MKTTLAILLLMFAGTLTRAQMMSSHAPTQARPASISTAATATTAAAKPVARVNGAVLTDRDLVREELAIFPYARQHGGQIPSEMEPGIRQGAMQMIIFEELAYQEAERRKMTVPAEKLQKAEADFRKQFHSTAEYQEFLKAEFQGSEAKLREKIRRSLLIDVFLKAEVADKSVVSVAELKAYYDKNPAKFEYPEAYGIQTISFIPPQKATPQQLQEARKRADETLPKAQAAKTYEEFGLLAEKVSEDDYRVMMGAHKPMPRADLSPQVLKALDGMQAGQVTGVIQVDQIFTIVRLGKHMPAGKSKLEDVKTKLKQDLEKTKTNQVRASLDKKLRQNAKIEVL